MMSRVRNWNHSLEVKDGWLWIMKHRLIALDTDTGITRADILDRAACLKPLYHTRLNRVEGVIRPGLIDKTSGVPG